MGQLALLADDLVAAKRKVLAYLAQQALELGPDSLRVVALISGSYALLVYLGAWAAWTERRWGDWLLVALVALPLPYEIFEVIDQRTLGDAILLGLNLIALLILLRRVRRHRRHISPRN